MDNNLLDKLMQDTWGQLGNFRIPFYNGEKPFHIGAFAFLCLNFIPEGSRYTQREKELAQLTLMIEQLDTQRNSLQEQLKKDLQHFTGLINSIPEPDREAVMDERVRLRKQITRELYHSLQAKEPEFNFSRAANAERKIDDFTGETGQMQKILLRKRKKQTSRQSRNSEERAL